MADTTQYAALMLDANGNVDRMRTTDGKIYYIASTIAMDAANKAHAAASACNSATDRANAAEEKRVSAENTRASNEQSRLSAEGEPREQRGGASPERETETDRRGDAHLEREREEIEPADARAQRGGEKSRRDQAQRRARRRPAGLGERRGGGERSGLACRGRREPGIADRQLGRAGQRGDSDISDLRDQNAALATMLADATGKFLFIGGNGLRAVVQGVLQQRNRDPRFDLLGIRHDTRARIERKLKWQT